MSTALRFAARVAGDAHLAESLAASERDARRSAYEQHMTAKAA